MLIDQVWPAMRCRDDRTMGIGDILEVEVSLLET